MIDSVAASAKTRWMRGLKVVSQPYVIRMKVPKGVTEFQDLVQGKVVFDNDTLDDPVLMKSDEFPTYDFANVVDDYLMRSELPM